jgi:HEAT repeat protein
VVPDSSARPEGSGGNDQRRLAAPFLCTDASDRVVLVEDASDEVYLRLWMEKILPPEQWERFSAGMIFLHAKGRPAGDGANQQLDAIKGTHPDGPDLQPIAFVVADRDYRHEEELQEERDKLSKQAFARQRWHVWQERVEIENYLIDPDVIAHHVAGLANGAGPGPPIPPPSIEEVRALIEQTIEASRDAARMQLVNTFGRVRKGWAPASCVEEAERFLERVWRGSGRIWWCDAKKVVLPRLRGECKRRWNISLSDRELVRSFRRDQVPGEIVQVVEAIASFLSESYWLRLGPAEREMVRPLAHGLRSRDPKLRRTAAESLGGKGRAGLPALSRALRDEDAGVRRAAAWGLLRIGVEAGLAVPALINALADGDREVREHAATALGAVGTAACAAVPRLIKLLQTDSWPGPRQRAASALGRIGEAGSVVLALTGALGDPDTNVRVAAAEALGLLGPAAAEAAPELLIAVKDRRVGCEGVRQYAGFALGRIGLATPDVLRALSDALRDPHRDPRRFAARALGDLGSRAETEAGALMAALGDEELVIRQDAIEALGKIGGPVGQVVPALVSALRNEDWRLRLKGAEALGRIGPRAVEAAPELEQLLEQDVSGVVRVQVASALVSIRGQPELSVPHLAARLSDADLSARIAAAEALRALGPAAGAAVPALAEALKDGHWRVCAEAARSLGAIGTGAAGAVSALTEALRDRYPAADSMGSAITWGDGPVYDWVRYEAAAALGTIGAAARPALPALQEATRHQALVRDGALEAIRRIELAIEPSPRE